MKRLFLIISLISCFCSLSDAKPRDLEPQVVKPGIEVLREQGFKPLAGKRVGLVTNPSGVDRNLVSTVDILHNAPEVNLVALFRTGTRGAWRCVCRRKN